MPSINDLKNDGNVRQPFIPTIAEVDDDNNTSNGGFIPTISEEDEPVTTTSAPKKKPNVLSMTSGKVVREKLDLNTLPKKEPEGVILKESIEKDILGPGGIFEDYLKEKTEEAAEFFAEEDLAREVEENSKDDEDTKENEEKTAEELEIEELEKEYENTDDSLKEMDSIFNNTEETVSEVPVNVKEEVVTDDSDNIEIEREIVTNTGTEEIVTDEDELAEDTSSDDNDDSNLEEDSDRYLQIIKNEISKRIKPVSKKMDISNFTIISKPIMSNNIIESKEVPVAKWALPTTGTTFKVKEILGSNIEKIRTAISGGHMDIVLQIIYDNIISPKPESMMLWAKSIAYDDFDHLFMGIYIAAFTDSNYISMTCPNPNCKDKVFVTDNIPMEQMVKFKDAEAEKKFKALLNSNAVNPKGLITSEIIPISNRFAFGFKIPSLYDIYIEDRLIDDTFRAKYENASAIVPYIDKIYYIDTENNQLIPVGFTEYVNNQTKTVKSKIIRYDKVLSTLGVDEINVIKAYMVKIVEESQSISYQVPEATCPHCGHKIAAQPISGSQLVFTRNQLTLLLNI